MKFFEGEASDYAGYLMLCIKNGVSVFLNSETISRVYIISDYLREIVSRSNDISTYKDVGILKLVSNVAELLSKM